jgi:MFS family permease
LLLALAVGWLVLRRIQRAEVVALVLLAAFLACRHQRFVVFFAMVVAPVIAGLLADVFPAYEPDKNVPMLNAALIALFAAGAAAFFPSSARLQRLIDHNQPRRAVDYLRSHPVPGPMFNDDFWGGYLIWASRGQQKVFIDGRSDAYEPSGVLADYIKIIQPAPEALALLEKYGVRSCLVERSGSLGALLDAQPGWGRVYEDDLCILFVRKER